MGEQVANNREQQNLLYLKEVDGEWYLLEEPKGSGLIKKEYIPMGNRLVYPKKWSREQAVEVFLNHIVEQQHKIIIFNTHSLLESSKEFCMSDIPNFSLTMVLYIHHKTCDYKVIWLPLNFSKSF